MYLQSNNFIAEISGKVHLCYFMSFVHMQINLAKSLKCARTKAAAVCSSIANDPVIPRIVVSQKYRLLYNYVERKKNNLITASINKKLC